MARSEPSSKERKATKGIYTIKKSEDCSIRLLVYSGDTNAKVK